MNARAWPNEQYNTIITHKKDIFDIFVTQYLNNSKSNSAELPLSISKLHEAAIENCFKTKTGRVEKLQNLKL